MCVVPILVMIEIRIPLSNCLCQVLCCYLPVHGYSTVYTSSQGTSCVDWVGSAATRRDSSKRLLPVVEGAVGGQDTRACRF